jgi:RNA polymerase sigma-70 factor (ECF subfamily)
MSAAPDELSGSKFAEFYRRNAPALWSFVRRTCGDSEQTNDILQEAFLRLLRSRPVGMDDRQMRAYLRKISYRLVIDGWRRAGLEKKHLADSPEASGQRGETLAPDMERTFALLKPRDRTLLWLAHVEGYSHKEIASITGLREESIKVLLFRSRSALAKHLRERGYGGETDHE